MDLRLTVRPDDTGLINAVIGEVMPVSFVEWSATNRHNTKHALRVSVPCI